MGWLRNYILFLAMLGLVTGCKHQKKKPSLAGDEPVEFADFSDSFQPLKLTYEAGDTILDKKGNDSLLIGYKVLIQFVPDSIVAKIFGKGIKPKIYPIGKIMVPKAEMFFLVKAITEKNRSVLILCFDNTGQFVAYLTALQPDKLATTSQSLSIDKKLAIIKTTIRKNKNGTISDGKDVYTIDLQSKKFVLVMTDPLDDKITELINPIDTLPRKNKFAADYGTGKMNLISIRDGRKPGWISFFIHFEKNNGECTGELKGEALFRKANIAEYRENGESCMLQFIFSSSSVQLKEIEGCGSRRGMNCLFNGAYSKKKTPKSLSAKQARK